MTYPFNPDSKTVFFCAKLQAWTIYPIYPTYPTSLIILLYKYLILSNLQNVFCCRITQNNPTTILQHLTTLLFVKVLIQFNISILHQKSILNINNLTLVVGCVG